jgi:hypothetical protein
MKKILPQIFIAVFLAFFAGQVKVEAQISATGPLITEYVAGAGGGNYSFIEFYNGTGAELFLEDYSIVTAVNGKYMTDKDAYNWGVSHINGFPVPDPKTGDAVPNAGSVVLKPGEIYLYVNENAWKKLDSIVPNLPKTGVYVCKSDWTAHLDNWNGQGPGKTFVYLSEADQSVTPVDVVGVPGITEEWGDGWGGLHKVFARKSTIKKPVTVFNSDEWNVTNADKTSSLSVLSGLGFHPNTKTAVAPDKKINFNVYPNPATNRVFIETASSEQLKIKVYDLRGAVVVDCLSSNKGSIDLSELVKGCYIIQASTKTESLQQKLIIK